MPHRIHVIISQMATVLILFLSFFGFISAENLKFLFKSDLYGKCLPSRLTTGTCLGLEGDKLISSDCVSEIANGVHPQQEWQLEYDQQDQYTVTNVDSNRRLPPIRRNQFDDGNSTRDVSTENCYQATADSTQIFLVECVKDDPNQMFSFVNSALNPGPDASEDNILSFEGSVVKTPQMELTLHKALNNGGFGAVYQSSSPDLVVKILSSNRVDDDQNVLKEIIFLRKINQYHGSGTFRIQENLFAFIIMNRIPGDKLRRQFYEANPLPANQWAKAALDAYTSLYFTHGILHNDVTELSNTFFQIHNGKISAQMIDYGNSHFVNDLSKEEIIEKVNYDMLEFQKGFESQSYLKDKVTMKFEFDPFAESPGNGLVIKPKDSQESDKPQSDKPQNEKPKNINKNKDDPNSSSYRILLPSSLILLVLSILLI